jgi:nicotinamidase-related amidase
MFYLDAQYLSGSTPQGVPCTEQNLVLRKTKLPFLVGQCALILVDVWNDHYIESLATRQGQIIQEAIVPVLDAARQANMTIIHAPGPDVVIDEPVPSPSALLPGWPPDLFRARRGEYIIYRSPVYQYPSLADKWAPIRAKLAIHELVAPRPGEPIVASGPKLHYHLMQRQILHLFYCGFAANMCILGRTYGIRYMRDAGYNTMLIRDATTGVESEDTIDGVWATYMAIREVEQNHGFTVTAEDFIAACNTERD